jgi:hypothetical protein
MLLATSWRELGKIKGFRVTLLILPGDNEDNQDDYPHSHCQVKRNQCGTASAGDCLWESQRVGHGDNGQC